MVQEIKGIFHIHTKYSYDIFLEVRDILSSAKKNGYDFVIITDHNTIQESLEAKKHEKEFELVVVPGAEYKSENGDIIGIFIEDEIKSKTALEIIGDIKLRED